MLGALQPDRVFRRARSWRPGPRHLLTLLIAAACTGLLVYVAPPGQVIDQISDMSAGWLVLAVTLELASCASYVLVFRRFFPEPAAADARRLSWISMAAGAVLPGGNMCSAAATGWLLRRGGISRGQLLSRCATLVCLFTAVNLVATITADLMLLGHLAAGPHDLEHGLLPAVVCSGLLFGLWAVGALIRRRGERAAHVTRAFGEGIAAAWDAIEHPNWRMLGAVGYVCFDMGALWAAFRATGHPLSFESVIVAYDIGYLATLIPMPAGLGVLDTGLSASVVLYGGASTAAVGAVLVYHAVAIWVPGLGGLAAWLPAQRDGRRQAATGKLLQPVVAGADVVLEPVSVAPLLGG